MAFTASPVTGTVPLTVTFTNQSTPAGAITAYLWNLGDGYTSTFTNPVHVYTSAGSFTVTLTAYAGTEQNTLTKMDYITVTSVAVEPVLVTTTIRYTYDPLQRLTGASYSGGYTYTFAYEYDAVGDRTVSTQTITSTLVTTYTYDTANRLTAVNSQAYTWDANGNLTNDGSKVYTYTQANRLSAVTAPGLTWSATYNGDGARLKQTTNSSVTTYTLDLAAPLVTVLAERNGSTKQYLYGLGDSPLAGYDGAAWTYLSGRDGLNSVRQETDAVGNVIAVRSFDPYGMSLSGNGGSPYGYTGEQTDSTGLVFLRARYYDVRVGRFSQQDPSGLDPNLYLYAGVNPVISTDPTGECTYRPGDPEGTCRVDPGDTGLYRIAISQDPPINPWEQIKAWNPEYVPPQYIIHAGNLIYLRAREATPPVSGNSPLDTISGYLEGEMRSSTIACLTYWVDGDEIVYDFARIPPERARFTYKGMGISLSTSPSVADLTTTGYAGFIWGFDPNQALGILEDYRGVFLSASVGATVNLPPGFASFGGGFGGFTSPDLRVFGFDAYTSASVNAGTPGVGLTFSFLGTYYTGDTMKRYDPLASGMHSAISTGDSSPVQSNPLIAGTRSSTADHVYNVLGRYYATQGKTPLR